MVKRLYLNWEVPRRLLYNEILKLDKVLSGISPANVEDFYSHDLIAPQLRAVSNNLIYCAVSGLNCESNIKQIEEMLKPYIQNGSRK